MNIVEERIEIEVVANAEVVGDRLRAAADALGRNKYVLAFYLHSMEELRLFQTTGHGSTVHFAETQLDMEPRRTREFIQVGRSLWGLKEVDRAFRQGELSWSRVLLLLRVVQTETQAAWVQFARSVTCRELRDEVYGCDPGDLPGHGNHYGLRHRKANFEARLGDDDLHWVEQARVLLSASPERPLSDEELLVELARARVLAEGGERPPSAEVEPPLPPEDRNHDPIPDEIRTEVLRRDHHRCRNCRGHLDVDLHHIQFRRHGGNNTPHNLVTLCKTCHSSIHRDLLRLTGNPDHQLAFTSANGTPIHRGERPPPPN